jgi:hypothetical protein
MSFDHPLLAAAILELADRLDASAADPGPSAKTTDHAASPTADRAALIDEIGDTVLDIDRRVTTLERERSRSLHPDAELEAWTRFAAAGCARASWHPDSAAADARIAANIADAMLVEWRRRATGARGAAPICGSPVPAHPAPTPCTREPGHAGEHRADGAPDDRRAEP